MRKTGKKPKRKVEANDRLVKTFEQQIRAARDNLDSAIELLGHIEQRSSSARMGIVSKSGIRSIKGIQRMLGGVLSNILKEAGF